MSTNINRRTFLKQAMSTSALAIAAGAGLLQPGTVLAAWPKAAFDANKTDAALNTLFGNSSAAASGDIKILAPPIAENGAVVNVSVSTSMSNIEAIAIMVEKNPNPLATQLKALDGSVQGYLKTRIKMGKTSNVVAVVKSGGKLYSAKQEVKVTLGGCGG
jgi:sulfur-oxidizing protein SoxY